MKKKIGLVVILSIMLSALVVILWRQSRIVQFAIDDRGQLVLQVQSGENKEYINSWYSEYEDVYYYFFPSFVDENIIYNDLLQSNIVAINDTPINKNSSFVWEEDINYTISFEGEHKKTRFMRSANLPALFIKTDTQGMNYLHESKENFDSGKISVISSDGKVEHQGGIQKISCRGNSTFGLTPKKSYSVTLEEGQELCGLEYGKKWALLSLHFEHDKIHSKIVFDMAKYMGMDYAPECTWVDLYCNGDYMGLYLLTEAITVAEGRIEIEDLEKANEEKNPSVDFQQLVNVQQESGDAYFEIDSPEDITGGYLLEKVVLGRSESQRSSYFTTEIYGYEFRLDSPKHASFQEYEYIKNYIQTIEDLIAEGDDSYWEFLDVDSFAKQYLLDQLVINQDAMWESTYYYKEQGDSFLRAGIPWDYDRSFGATNANYKSEIQDACNAMAGWYLEFYEDETFRKKMLESYEELLPYLEQVLDEQIDAYADYIKAAIKMDSVRIPTNSGYNCHSYMNYDNEIKYLKFFLASRVNFLNDLWGIEYEEFPLPVSTEEYHTVRFWNKNGALVREHAVKDGDFYTELMNFDIDKYYGWTMFSEKLYDSMRPVYEDIDLYLTPRVSGE